MQTELRDLGYEWSVAADGLDQRVAMELCRRVVLLRRTLRGLEGAGKGILHTDVWTLEADMLGLWMCRGGCLLSWEGEGHVEEGKRTQLEGSCPTQCQQLGEGGGDCRGHQKAPGPPPPRDLVKHDRMQRAI
ncbi:unnamed protein product [Boreogadus saida]